MKSFNEKGTIKAAFSLKTPRVGLEPTSKNKQAATNEGLTEKQNPVLSTGLDKILQKYHDLRQIVVVWPELSEDVKVAIKALIATHNKHSE